MYVCVYACMSMYVCMYVCLSVYVCMYVCVCVCMYVYVCMYVCSHVVRSVKVKESGYRPDSSWGFQEVEACKTSRQSAREGGKVVSPTHRPPLPRRKYSWYSFLLEVLSTPGPQCGRKDYVNDKFHSNPRPSGL